MDNNAFERNMIDFVNTNAKTAETERVDQFRKELEKWKERRKAEKIRAIIELLCWVLGFAILVIAFGLLAWFDVFSAEVAVPIPAVLGFVTGIRVCGLVTKI